MVAGAQVGVWDVYVLGIVTGHFVHPLHVVEFSISLCLPRTSQIGRLQGELHKAAFLVISA